ncbi:SCO2523 family variant P-loop protein [Phytohabitans sp. ZYX-F-186]|uniref:SCO2523 family variant P-loop protein n=1 Tax=Phytohabitans maris TaxID=3071409 RepID=A0ABU0ZB44_9ACTN|nr:SCO2523 family variant P-loop protein [Phytohabitans sp. ZYX-F-186]MDQ7904274.1 SCO2523 family variant P-loop protein [Phytohabitans sp. ZYX-F-186]
MLVFATSDKGGTGRSVTSSNVAYRRALQGSDVCYLDFDFGSPTAGTIFNVDNAARGVTSGLGLHSYMQGRVSEPVAIDIWTESDRPSLRHRPPGAGRLVLFPGDAGGSEFSIDDEAVQRCVRLLRRVDEEFELCLLDLSAGRSYATDMVLAATAAPEMRSVTARWLVFHRWTRQHIIAANGLVHGRRGIIEVGQDRGHDPRELADSIRFVRTAVVDPNSDELAGLRSSQIAWLRDCNRDLQELASARKVGRTTMLGAIPLDPVLQWREQLISDNDVYARQIANRETVDAFELLAKRLTEDAVWVSL